MGDVNRAVIRRLEELLSGHLPDPSWKRFDWPSTATVWELNIDGETHQFSSVPVPLMTHVPDLAGVSVPGLAVSAVLEELTA